MAVNSLDSHGSACPYCGFRLARWPRRQGSCPACGMRIFVKSTPDDRVKRAMTEAKANHADELWAVYNARQEHLHMLYPFGLDARHIEERIALGQSETAAIRFLLCNAAHQSADLHKRQMAYSQLALLADKEQQPFQELLAKRTLWQLLHLKRASVKRVSILTDGRRHACGHCVATHGEVWDIDEALKLMPIPRPGCTARARYSNRTGYCTCLWVADVSHLKSRTQ
jgi:DNA-directed RNA polymerase subunit RPC12/RpoP